jgi:carboxylate-amine ligase
MPLEPFAQSDALTFGVELELQLVSLSDFDLTAASPDLLHLLARKPFPGNVTPEITESMIEINSSVHTAHLPLLAELQEIRDTWWPPATSSTSASPAAAPTPSSTGRSRKSFPSRASRAVLAVRLPGQAVHGVRPARAHRLRLGRRRHVPAAFAEPLHPAFHRAVGLLALRAGARQPFRFGAPEFRVRLPDERTRALHAVSWDEFANVYFAKMERTGIVKSMKDFYWDLRPKPEYGTIELRVCDTPLTVERAAALAAICRRCAATCWSGFEEPPVEDDYLVYNYNRFQACRFGLDGSDHASEDLRDDVAARGYPGDAAQDGAVCEALGSLDGLRHLAAAADGAAMRAAAQQYERRAASRGWCMRRSTGSRFRRR